MAWITRVNTVYVRETCFDLVDYPQALQENRSKSCLVFLQLLDLFSWTAWGWPTRSKHVALTYIPLYIKINVVLLTDVLCLYVVTLRDGKLQTKKKKELSVHSVLQEKWGRWEICSRNLRIRIGLWDPTASTSLFSCMSLWEVL